MRPVVLNGVALKLGEIDRETRRRAARVLGQIIADHVLREISESGKDPVSSQR